jgi:hypothetical protein
MTVLALGTGLDRKLDAQNNLAVSCRNNMLHCGHGFAIAPAPGGKDMNLRDQLPLEQQFELRRFEDEVRDLSLEEAQELLICLNETMVIQTHTFRDMIKESWGMGQDWSNALKY